MLWVTADNQLTINPKDGKIPSWNPDPTLIVSWLLAGTHMHYSSCISSTASRKFVIIRGCTLCVYLQISFLQPQILHGSDANPMQSVISPISIINHSAMSRTEKLSDTC